MDEQVERTLCQLPSCHIFKIPPQKDAAGHRASDWDSKPMCTTRLRIVARGREANIILIDNENKVFARAPVEPGAVERTVDSGRYFVIRIKNEQGKHAYIGIAFNERNDAFDFNVALQEHANECAREDLAASGSTGVTEEFEDLSLKDGQKIKINFGGGGGGSRRDKSEGLLSMDAPSGSKKGPLLAPPRARGASALLNPPPARGAQMPTSSAPQGFEGLTATTTMAAMSGAPVPGMGQQPPVQSNPFGDTFGDSFSVSSSAPPASVFQSVASPDPFSQAAVPVAQGSNPFASVGAPQPMGGGSSDPFASLGAAAMSKPASGGGQPAGSVNLFDF